MPERTEIYQFGPWRIDCRMRTLWRNQEPYHLTGKEFDILVTLARRAPDPVDRAMIVAEVWPGQAAVTDDTLRQHVSSLRRKLCKDDLGRDYIGTVPQQGYFLRAEVIAVDEEPPDQAKPSNVGVAPVAPVIAAEEGSAPSSTRRMIALAARAMTLFVILFAVVLRGDIVHLRFGPSVAPGRLLVRATSEGKRPKRIPLSHIPHSLAISPAGDKLFALATYGRVLSIIRTEDKDAPIKTLKLPSEGVGLAVSPDGKLYIASAIDGIMVVDIARERIAKTVATGGPVRDIAIDPYGENLFLAMDQLGFKRLSLGSGVLTVITERTCPIHVAVDHRGERLYVAYQCSGPSGRPGHDSVEIFDARTDKRLGIVSGPPMVGGYTSISPDGRLAILDGGDACSRPGYDHAGCALVPSRVFHLLRDADRQILHTFVYPPESPAVYNEGGYFVDNSRLLMFSNSISVVDAATYALLERSDLGQRAVSAVVARDGSRFWAGIVEPPGLLEFNPEPASCTAQEPSPAMLFPADGGFDDASGSTVLRNHGQVAFTPGKVGQAFFLDGHSYLSADSTGYYHIYRHNFSITLYVRFLSVAGEVALADWSATVPQRGIRMSKSSDNHFVFQSWPGGSPITSSSKVAPNVWYHVAVTKTDDSITLYVNGKAEASGKPPAHFATYDDALFLGADEPGRPSLHGWLDEIAFYNRGLTAAEVGGLYRHREAGSCKPN